MKVSILLLTLNRFEITKHCVDMALRNASFPYELLCVDNGSTDQRVIDYVRSLNPEVHILNKRNRGIAPMHNMLLRMASGEFFVLIGNDIELPVGWLEHLVHVYNAIPDSGLVGIHCVETLHPPKDLNGIIIHEGHNVFGTMFFSRDTFRKIGYFNESYFPYGLDDSDYAYRMIKIGLRNYYVYGMTSKHIGDDMHHNDEYRQMKTESLNRNVHKFNENIYKYDQSGNYYLPLGDEPYTIFNEQFER